MDRIERMIVRSYTDWRERLRTRGLSLYCPGCGDSRTYAFEVHEIAGKAFGDLSLPHCVACHRHLTAWQDTEHPPILDAPPSQREKWGRFLIGLADVRELQTDLLREIGEQLIAEGQQDGPSQ